VANVVAAAGPVTSIPELAARLGLSPNTLRGLIRRYSLVPQHKKGTPYKLSEKDVRRIAAHPAVIERTSAE
jgi:transposase